MIVDLDYINKIKKTLAKVNAEPLDNLQFIKGGLDVHFDSADIELFEYTGLNNTDITDVITYTFK